MGTDQLNSLLGGIRVDLGEAENPRSKQVDGWAVVTGAAKRLKFRWKEHKSSSARYMEARVPQSKAQAAYNKAVKAVGAEMAGTTHVPHPSRGKLLDTEHASTVFDYGKGGIHVVAEKASDSDAYDIMIMHFRRKGGKPAKYEDVGRSLEGVLENIRGESGLTESSGNPGRMLNAFGKDLVQLGKMVQERSRSLTSRDEGHKLERFLHNMSTSLREMLVKGTWRNEGEELDGELLDEAQYGPRKYLEVLVRAASDLERNGRHIKELLGAIPEHMGGLTPNAAFGKQSTKMMPQVRKAVADAYAASKHALQGVKALEGTIRHERGK
jgi:hypothetical protein